MRYNNSNNRNFPNSMNSFSSNIQRNSFGSNQNSIGAKRQIPNPIFEQNESSSLRNMNSKPNLNRESSLLSSRSNSRSDVRGNISTSRHDRSNLVQRSSNAVNTKEEDENLDKPTIRSSSKSRVLSHRSSAVRKSPSRENHRKDKEDDFLEKKEDNRRSRVVSRSNRNNRLSSSSRLKSNHYDKKEDDNLDLAEKTSSRGDRKRSNRQSKRENPYRERSSEEEFLRDIGVNRRDSRSEYDASMFAEESEEDPYDKYRTVSKRLKQTKLAKNEESKKEKKQEQEHNHRSEGEKKGFFRKVFSRKR